MKRIIILLLCAIMLSGCMLMTEGQIIGTQITEEIGMVLEAIETPTPELVPVPDYTFDEEINDKFHYQGLSIYELQSQMEYLMIPHTFPYIDQVGADAPYIDDCGSASVMMVAEFYGVAKDMTVEEHHKDLARGDFPTTFAALRDYLEDEYHLEVGIVTNNKYTIPALEDRGYDVSDIEFVTTDDINYIQNRGPMIWAYALEAHWVVRYGGWNFDPLHGIWMFKTTEVVRGIVEPELGLGLYIIEQGE